MADADGSTGSSRPAHPHGRVGRPRRRRRDHRATSPRRGDLDVIAITDHERIDAALAGRAIARDRGLPVDVVVGEEVTTLGGHLLALFVERRIKPYRTLGRTIADIHEAGGIAIPAHPLVPYPLCAQGWVLRRLLDDPDDAVRPDGARDLQPDGARAAVARSGRALRRRSRTRPHRQQRRPRARCGRGGLDDVSRPHGRRSADGDRGAHDRSRRLVPRHGRPVRRVRSAGPQARHRRP